MLCIAWRIRFPIFLLFRWDSHLLINSFSTSEAHKLNSIGLLGLNYLSSILHFISRQIYFISFQFIYHFWDSFFLQKEVTFLFLWLFRFLKTRLDRIRPSILHSDLPKGIVHGDVFSDNALFLNGRLVAIIDWEEVCEDSLLIDVGMTICGKSGFFFFLLLHEFTFWLTLEDAAFLIIRGIQN